MSSTADIAGDTPSYFTRIEDGVAIVTLNRPDVHNAFDDALIAALYSEFERLDTTRRRASSC